ncbi:MAG: adenylyltransferase/cytidyltransferase family protein [Candidatus Micrarchaeota archaeon]|nr:adenylyltransferase/cytidyltransferase family protein [Candidatus Micrarchaeota archaeon]
MKKKEDQDKVKVGVFTGRFQPVHLGHVDNLVTASLSVHQMDILIYDLPLIFNNGPKRLSKKSNPFSYEERHMMLHSALLEYGMREDQFRIDSLKNYVAKLLKRNPETGSAGSLAYHIERHGLATYALEVAFKAAGHEVHVIEDYKARRDPENSKIRAVDVRNLLRDRGDWEVKVPTSARGIIRRHAFN